MGQTVKRGGANINWQRRGGWAGQIVKRGGDNTGWQHRGGQLGPVLLRHCPHSLGARAGRGKGLIQLSWLCLALPCSALLCLALPCSALLCLALPC